MGRCGGWSRGIALALAVVAASCGGTGGGPSDSGNPLVFQARGRLNLIVQPTNDPRVLTLIATLLDPQGVPFRNQAITFAAEFRDATFIPSTKDPNAPDPITSNNEGVAFTNNIGQAQIRLVAGLTIGSMRVTAEAPPALNISTGITIELTEQGFVSIGDLGIIPSAITFVNPMIDPNIPRECPNTPQGNPDATFSAVGGTPPYRWDNSNKDLGRICPTGLPNINQTADYTLIGPIPIENDEAPEVLQDTITLQDAAGGQAPPAMVTVIFAECTLNISPDTPINFTNAMGGETAQITVTNGVPFTTGDPFTVTQGVPEAGDISFDPQNPDIIIFTVATPPVPVDSNTVLIRDSRGCTASVNVTVTVSDPVITPGSVMLSPGQRQQFIVTGGVPPYQIIPSGGTVDTETITEAGGSFIYTAGLAEGTFSIVVTDARNSVVEATVTIEVATLEVQPDEERVCNFIGRTIRITVLSGVPPFTATHTFNAAGTLICEEPDGETGDIVTCQGNRILYLVTTEGSFDPDSVIIQDSQGGVATVSIAINGEDCPEIELCGNGTRDQGEQCDTLDLGGATCTGLGFSGGGLTCNADCTFNTSGCTNPNPTP